MSDSIPTGPRGNDIKFSVLSLDTADAKPGKSKLDWKYLTDDGPVEDISDITAIVTKSFLRQSEDAPSANQFGHESLSGVWPTLEARKDLLIVPESKLPAHQRSVPLQAIGINSYERDSRLVSGQAFIRSTYFRLDGMIAVRDSPLSGLYRRMEATTFSSPGTLHTRRAHRITYCPADTDQGLFSILATYPNVTLINPEIDMSTEIRQLLASRSRIMTQPGREDVELGNQPADHGEKSESSRDNEASVQDIFSPLLAALDEADMADASNRSMSAFVEGMDKPRYGTGKN